MRVASPLNVERVAQGPAPCPRVHLPRPRLPTTFTLTEYRPQQAHLAGQITWPTDTTDTRHDRNTSAIELLELVAVAFRRIHNVLLNNGPCESLLRNVRSVNSTSLLQLQSKFDLLPSFVISLI